MLKLILFYLHSRTLTIIVISEFIQQAFTFWPEAKSGSQTLDKKFGQVMIEHKYIATPIEMPIFALVRFRKDDHRVTHTFLPQKVLPYIFLQTFSSSI